MPKAPRSPPSAPVPSLAHPQRRGGSRAAAAAERSAQAPARQRLLAAPLSAGCGRGDSRLRRAPARAAPRPEPRSPAGSARVGRPRCRAGPGPEPAPWPRRRAARRARPRAGGTGEPRRTRSARSRARPACWVGAGPAGGRGGEGVPAPRLGAAAGAGCRAAGRAPQPGDLRRASQGEVLQLGAADAEGLGWRWEPTGARVLRGSGLGPLLHWSHWCDWEPTRRQGEGRVPGARAGRLGAGPGLHPLLAA